MNLAEFTAFTTYYYRAPAPARAPAALAWFVASPLIHDPLSRAPMAHFFARLLRQHAELEPRYEALEAAAGPPGHAFIEDLLVQLRAPDPVDALARPIRTPTDNDILWAEFCLTGRPEPVRSLIDVLDWPDRVRAHLEDWLASTPPAVLGSARRWRRRWIALRLRCATGIVCHLVRGTVVNEDDLDCRCMLEGLRLSRHRFRRAVRRLPFALSGDDVNHMGIKASAKWSLGSNAQQHSRVRDVCESEAAGRQGRARHALREILAASPPVSTC